MYHIHRHAGMLSDRPIPAGTGHPTACESSLESIALEVRESVDCFLDCNMQTRWRMKLTAHLCADFHFARRTEPPCCSRPNREQAGLRKLLLDQRDPVGHDLSRDSSTPSKATRPSFLVSLDSKPVEKVVPSADNGLTVDHISDGTLVASKNWAKVATEFRRLPGRVRRRPQLTCCSFRGLNHVPQA
jgi:hypothetical protein